MSRRIHLQTTTNWKSLLGPIHRAVGKLREAGSRDPDLPDNFTSMDTCDGHAVITGPCGDTMEFWIRVSNQVITKATYITDGCWSSIASGYTAARLAEGSTVETAAMMEQENVLSAMGGLPPESQHCALLATNTLKAAIADFRKEIEEG